MKTELRPLTKRQKAALAQMARKAYNKLSKYALAEDQDFTTWRRAQQKKTVGKSSLTACQQRHYLQLRAHFQNLVGDVSAAFNSHMKRLAPDTDGTKEERERVLHKIKQQLDGSKYTLGYALAIARNKFSKPLLRDLLDLTKPQLLELLFTVTDRVKATK